MAFRLIYLVLLIVMQFCYHDRHDFPLFMVLYALLFAAYIVLVWKGRASKGDMIWLALYASVFFFKLLCYPTTSTVSFGMGSLL